MRNRILSDTCPGNFTTARALIILELMALTGLLPGCALIYRDIKPPTAELISVQPETLGNDLSLAINTLVRISNPNTVALPIEGGRLVIELNGTPVAETKLTDYFVIAANSSTDVDFRVNVNLITGLQLGLNMLNSQQDSINWQLRGHVDVGLTYLGRVPINESGSIKLGTVKAH